MIEYGNFTIVSYGQKYFFLNNKYNKYIFYSNFKYKVPDIQLSDRRKEKDTFPWYFFQNKQKNTKICNIPIGCVSSYLS